MAKSTTAAAPAAEEPVAVSDAPAAKPAPELVVRAAAAPAAPAPAPAEPVVRMSLDEFGEALSHLIRSPTLNSGFRRRERDAGRHRDTYENFLARFEEFRGAKPGTPPAKA